MNIPSTPNRFIDLAALLIVAFSALSSAKAQQSRRAPAAREGRFVSGRSVRAIPFELHNNHIYLRVSVNNSEPLLFILDTGASTHISQTRAESLGLRLLLGEQATGVGEDGVSAAVVEGVSLRLPGVTLSRQRLAAIPLESLQASLGRPVDGILGYSFFRRFVVELNYATRIIKLHPPRGYRYRGRGEHIPLIIDTDSGLIFARARIKPAGRAPVGGLFEIDSGGGHALILNKPFVERHNLLTPAQKANPVSVGGIVGSSHAVTGTVESLQLGRIRVENVNTLFSLAAGGLLASEEFEGNIGNDVLRRYRVIFDYPHRVMILAPPK
jgi:predicted aspartyl protease